MNEAPTKEQDTIGAQAACSGCASERGDAATPAREKKPRGGTLSALASVPAALVALLPSFTCPACLAAYTGVLSSVGLGFMLTDRILTPLIAVFLVIGLYSVYRATRSHGRPGPLVATALGSALVVAGRLVWSAPPALYIGAGLLIAAAVWNVWLKRPRRRPLAVQASD